MSNVAVPNAYKGDSYSFTLTFPDASYLAGSPTVLAQIKSDPTSDTADQTFSTSIAGAVLTLSIAEITLDAGRYWFDVQVGDITYMKKTLLIVEQDVSR